MPTCWYIQRIELAPPPLHQPPIRCCFFRSTPGGNPPAPMDARAHHQITCASHAAVRCCAERRTRVRLPVLGLRSRACPAQHTRRCSSCARTLEHFDRPRRALAVADPGPFAARQLAEPNEAGVGLLQVSREPRAAFLDQQDARAACRYVRLRHMFSGPYIAAWAI